MDCPVGREEPVAARISQGDRRSGRPIGVATVVLADQAVLMHIALRALFTAHPQYSVLAATRTTFGAEQLVRRVRPQLLICDTEISGDSGIDLCRRARQVSVATRVVILTSREDPLLARSAIAAGAMGYVLKDTVPEVLIATLDGVLAGSVVVDPRLATSRAPSPAIDRLDDAGFSRREREVVTELVAGLDNKAIADRLWISEETVKCHVKAIFRKLGARDRAHAIAIALGTAVPATTLARTATATPVPRQLDGQ